MTIHYHAELVQGSDEWKAQRCGCLSASQVKLILTPTLKVTANEKERSHMYELLAQRITNHVEPQYVTDEMLRGSQEEIDARILYAKHHAPVEEMGFITNDSLGFLLGYSPDGLVGDDGLIEIKSRKNKYQVQTILDGKVPDEYMLQIQTGLLVTGRSWCDFVSISGGLPLFVKRVYPDLAVIEAITKAATAFEERLQAALRVYGDWMTEAPRVMAERKMEAEMYTE